MKLLHIDASILGNNSVSRQVTAAVVQRFRQADPHLILTYRDLIAASLPHLTLAQLPDHPLAALADASDSPTLARDRAISEVVLAEFVAADIVVIGAPMYNFTIPSQLKAWVDRILVAGKTFQYGPTGPIGLAGEKRVIVAISRGNFYDPESTSAKAEHMETYLRTVLDFIGVDPEIIVAEGTQRGPEQRQLALEGALLAVADLRAA